MLPWLGWKIEPSPQSEMNRLVESAGAIGNAVLGLVIALIGVVIVASL